MISRRGFLKAVLAAPVMLPLQKAFSGGLRDRSLSLFNIHTGESLDVTYYASGMYISDAIESINHLLRCHYTDTVRAIDLGLLDLLSAVRDIVGSRRECTIISGYRSPEYNEYLRSIGRRVVTNSLHTMGHAIDFSIGGIRNSRLASAAQSFAAGGVGIYPQFVHIDTGRVRYWQGT